MQLLEVVAQCPDDEVLEQCVYEANMIGTFDRLIMGSKSSENKRVIRKDCEPMVELLAKQFVDEISNQFPHKNKEKILDKFKDTIKRAIDENRHSIVFYFGKIDDPSPFEKILTRNGFKLNWAEGHEKGDIHKKHYWKDINKVSLNVQFVWTRNTIGTTMHTKRKAYVLIWSSKK